MLSTLARFRACLFLQAVAARLLLAPLFAHWVAIGICWLIGAPLDSSVAPTRAFTLLTLAAGVIGCLVGLRREGASARLQAGAASIVRRPYAVVAAGAVSYLGGLFLAYQSAALGAHQSAHPVEAGALQAAGAASWAMALGGAVVLAEVAAVAGSLVVGHPRDATAPAANGD